MSDMLERYRLAAVAARIHLSGSPFRNMTKEEYDGLSNFSRHAMGLMENRIGMASEELDGVLKDDPVAADTMLAVWNMKKMDS